MPIFTRSMDCSSVSRTGSVRASSEICPRADAASDGGTPMTDSGSGRDPNAALHNYIHQISPELIVGVLFILIIATTAVVLLLKFDKDLRHRLQRWAVKAYRWTMARTVKRPTRRQNGPPNPSSPASDITRIGTRTDEDDRRAIRPMLENKQQEPSQISVMKMEQVAALPVLLSRE